MSELKADKKTKRPSTLVLLSADTSDSEFTATVESVEILNTDRPQHWQVVVVEHGAKPRKAGLSARFLDGTVWITRANADHVG